MSLEDTDLTAEELAFRDGVRALARREIAPQAGQLDASHTFPERSVRMLAELGLLGVLLPEDVGGLGGTRMLATLAIEEIARACGATALTLMAHVHSTGLIAAYGDDDQRKRWLPKAATGEHLAAVAITEPEAGTDAAAMTSRARRGESTYVISGRKTFITNGDRADVVVVFAKVPEGDGPGGISAFIVNGSDPGVRAGAPFEKLGLRSSSTVELALDDVVVEQHDRLGDEGEGLHLALRSLDGARMSTAAQSVGLAHAAVDIALNYAKERRQGGRAIAHHQAVQLRLADMHIRTAAARALLYQVARLMDREGWDGNIAEAASAKVFCTQVGAEVAAQAVEVLGGYGYMEEYEAARLMRDAKGGTIYDGTNDVNRLLIVRQLLRAA